MYFNWKFEVMYIWTIWYILTKSRFARTDSIKLASSRFRSQNAVGGHDIDYSGASVELLIETISLL